MAQTYHDLRLEFDAMPYSKDMFEIQKESAEIAVLEKYVENQIYLQEHFEKDSNIDYMLEAANEITLKNIVNTIGNKIVDIGQKIWKLFFYLLELMGKLAASVVNWIKNVYNKGVIKKARETLKELIDKYISESANSENNDNLYTEDSTQNNNNKNNNKNNKNKFNQSIVLDKFMKAYKESSNKFKNGIFKKLNNSKLENIFNSMEIFLKEGHKSNKTSDSSNININKFYDADKNNNAVNVAKSFLEILNNDTFALTFKLPDSKDFPLMDIDEYLDVLFKLTNSCLNLKKISYGLFKNGIFIAGAYYSIPQVWQAFRLSGLFSTIPYKAFGTWFLVIWSSTILIDYLYKYYTTPSAPKIIELTIDLYHDSNKILQSLDKNNKFKMTLNEIIDDFAKYSIRYPVDTNLADNNIFNKDNAKFLKLSNAVKSIGNNIIDFKNFVFKNIPILSQFNTLKNSKDIKWKEIFFTKTNNNTYLKKYCEIGNNIMVLYNISADIANEIYKMSQAINKNYK